MHTTITPRSNALLVLLWCAVLAACFLLGARPSAAVVGVFAIVGLGAGLLQGGAICRRQAQFRGAATARQVRTVLISSSPGKASVALLWLAGGALLWLLLRGGEYASLQTVVGSYAAFSLARELASFPAIVVLARTN